MAALTTQVITRLGVLDSFTTAAGGGDTMVPSASTFLYVKNAGAGSITVTLTVPAGRTYEPNVAVTSPVVTVVNATNRLIGPVDAATFADPVTGLCPITYSGVTSVTVGVYQLQQP